MSEAKHQTLFVSGASGQLGKRVCDFLIAKKVKFIAGSRDVKKLADLQAKGVEVREANFEKPDELVKSLKGVDRFLIISTDTIDGSKRFNHHKNAFEAAKKAGVKYIVYTSLPGARPDPTSIINTDHFQSEVALANTGIPFTVLRLTLWIENFAWYFSKDVLSSGTWTHSMNDNAVINLVSKTDCAEACANVLAGSDTQTRMYELTGIRGVKAAEMAAAVSKTVGKTIKSQSIPVAKLQEILLSIGMSKDMASAYPAFWASANEGYYQQISGHIKQLTGHDPITMEDFLAKNKLFS